MFLSSKQAAEMLGVAESTLRKARSGDRILLGAEPPPYRKLGRKKVVYEAEAITQWINKHFPEANTRGGK